MKSGTYGFMSSPILMAISPSAQMALLHTDICSGSTFADNIGRNFAVKDFPSIERSCEYTNLCVVART